METHRISDNEMFVTDVTVTESDPYTKSVYLKFSRHYVPETIDGCSEMFISTKELRQLGHFLAAKAAEIEKMQRSRD